MMQRFHRAGYRWHIIDVATGQAVCGAATPADRGWLRGEGSGNPHTACDRCTAIVRERRGVVPAPPEPPRMPLPRKRM